MKTLGAFPETMKIWGHLRKHQQFRSSRRDDFKARSVNMRHFTEIMKT